MFYGSGHYASGHYRSGHYGPAVDVVIVELDFKPGGGDSRKKSLEEYLKRKDATISAEDEEIMAIILAVVAREANEL